MGSSIAMIVYHYGHIAHGSREHAVSLLDALAFERAVDHVKPSPAMSAAIASRRSPSRIASAI
jgi:hypothetical protein